MRTLVGADSFAATPGSDTDWREHLRSDHMSVGTYCIRAGGSDDQEPHTEDEIYYIVSGTGKFTGGTTTVDVGPGTTLFVPAREVHRFHDITADLTVIVVFAPAEGSEPSGAG